jgi:hypothetical protein
MRFLYLFKIHKDAENKFHREFVATSKTARFNIGCTSEFEFEEKIPKSKISNLFFCETTVINTFLGYLFMKNTCQIGIDSNHRDSQ